MKAKGAGGAGMAGAYSSRLWWSEEGGAGRAGRGKERQMQTELNTGDYLQRLSPGMTLLLKSPLQRGPEILGQHFHKPLFTPEH